MGAFITGILIILLLAAVVLALRNIKKRKGCCGHCQSCHGCKR